VAFIPRALKNEDIFWLDEGTPFGCCSVSKHPVPGGVVRIGAHA
jgi:hypothetical protein